MKKIEYEQKQVVVQKKSVKWKCEICGKEYRDEGDAYCCEQRHKNKEALSKVKPKFKAGDVVTFVDNWTGVTTVGTIYRVCPSNDYDRWLYQICRSGYCASIEASNLTFVCSKEDLTKIKKDFVDNVKDKLGVPKKNVIVELNPDGTLSVEFKTTVDKIPYIKQEEDCHGYSCKNSVYL